MFFFSLPHPLPRWLVIPILHAHQGGLPSTSTMRSVKTIMRNTYSFKLIHLVPTFSHLKIISFSPCYTNTLTPYFLPKMAAKCTRSAKKSKKYEPPNPSYCAFILFECSINIYHFPIIEERFVYFSWIFIYFLTYSYNDDFVREFYATLLPIISTSFTTFFVLK